jgi:hypothetical protein
MTHVDFIPALSCVETLRATQPAAHGEPPAVTIARLLADGAVFRITHDGAVLAAFGAAGSRLPTAFADAAKDPGKLAPLTGALVRDHLVTARGLLEQLGLGLSALDCQQVADLVAELARSRSEALAQAYERAGTQQRERWADESQTAKRRTSLLAELAELEPSTPDTPAVDAPRRWFRS